MNDDRLILPESYGFFKKLEQLREKLLTTILNFWMMLPNKLKDILFVHSAKDHLGRYKAC